MSDIILGYSTQLYEQELEIIRTTSRVVTEDDWKQNSIIPTGQGMDSHTIVPEPVQNSRRPCHSAKHNHQGRSLPPKHILAPTAQR